MKILIALSLLLPSLASAGSYIKCKGHTTDGILLEMLAHYTSTAYDDSNGFDAFIDINGQEAASFRYSNMDKTPLNKKIRGVNVTKIAGNKNQHGFSVIIPTTYLFYGIPKEWKTELRVNTPDDLYMAEVICTADMDTSVSGMKMP